MKTVLVIANPNARQATDELFEKLRACFEDAGLQAHIHASTDIEDAEQKLRDDGAQFDIIAIAGGDGTIHHLLPALIQIDKPVGLVPLGTGNDFARSLGIPEALPEAVHTMAAGKALEVDIGFVDGRPFLNALNIGFGQKIAEEHGGVLKRFLGSLSYPARWFRAHEKNKSFATEVLLDNREKAKFKADHITVANTHSFGRHLSIDDGNDVDSGKLSMLAVKPKSKLRWLMMLPSLLRGRPENIPGAASTQASSVHVKTRPKKQVSVDGEIIGTTPVKVEIEHKHLSVLVPK